MESCFCQAAVFENQIPLCKWQCSHHTEPHHRNLPSLMDFSRRLTRSARFASCAARCVRSLFQVRDPFPRISGSGLQHRKLAKRSSPPSLWIGYFVSYSLWMTSSSTQMLVRQPVYALTTIDSREVRALETLVVALRPNPAVLHLTNMILKCRVRAISHVIHPAAC